MIKVILNEQHSLMEDQTRVLNEKFGANNWELHLVPSAGWTLDEINAQVDSLSSEEGVVFASPIPAMILKLAKTNVETFVFHNDKREKKELPNGKIIMVVASEGWQLV